MKHKSVAQHGATLNDVRSAVATNAKKRFALKLMQADNTLLALDDAYITSDAITKVDINKLYIAAVQGHSIDVPDLELKLITKLSDLPEKSVVVHGTKKEFWQPIYDTVSTAVQMYLLHLYSATVAMIPSCTRSNTHIHAGSEQNDAPTHSLCHWTTRGHGGSVWYGIGVVCVLAGLTSDSHRHAQHVRSAHLPRH